MNQRDAMPTSVPGATAPEQAPPAQAAARPKAPPPAGAPPQVRRGLSASALKTIAIVAMLIDHVAHAFLPAFNISALAMVMRCIGRITGPTMFYFIVEGYHHTRNANRYTLRLAVFAVVSYLPFVWFSAGQPFPGVAGGALHFSVIYTLLLGLLALRARHEITSRPLRWVCIGAALLLATLGDWSFLAVVIILLFDAFRGNFRHQALAYCGVVLLEVLPLAAVMVQLLIQGQPAAYMGAYAAQLVVQSGMFLPIVLLRFYNGQKGRGGPLAKWGFYVFYPAHLLVLALIKTAMAGGL